MNFYKEQPLKTVEALIAQYESYIKDEPEFADLYVEDKADFEKAIELFRADDPEELASFICYLDTAPRECLVEAFAKDCGEYWVREQLGWDVVVYEEVKI